jgi:hypothetical protein
MGPLMRYFLVLVFSVVAFAQQPNCQINFGPWTDTATSTAFNNIGAGNNNQCTYWVMSYQVIGFSAISLQFESAVGGANLNTPGTFGAFSGTVSLGVNPSTSVSCSTVANCTAVFTGTVGWYRVNFLSHTGSGTITGTLKGYISGIPLGGQTPPSGTACPGTSATPCVVDGPTAAGSAATTAPVLAAGQDGAPGNIRVLQTDTTGRQIAVGAAPVGAAVAGNPVLQGWSDGTNAQNAFVCTLRTVITISAGTDAVIVAGVAAKKTIVCHIDFVSSAAQTFTIQEGTGATCGTGTATVAGAYANTITFAADYGASGALRTATNADDLCLHAGGAVTVGGVVTYAQF